MSLYNSWVKLQQGPDTRVQRWQSLQAVWLQMFKGSSSNNFRELPPSEESLEYKSEDNATMQDLCGVKPPVRNQPQMMTVLGGPSIPSANNLALQWTKWQADLRETD